MIIGVIEHNSNYQDPFIGARDPKVLGHLV